MPRISAPSLAEHRALQIHTLHTTTRALLREDPDTPPSLAEIAARAGFARSSVYQYVVSRDELLLDLVHDAAPRWRSTCTAAQARVKSPAQKVLAYLDALVRLLTGPERGLVTVLVTPWPDELRDEARAVCTELTAPLRAALAEVPTPDPDATAALLIGLTRAAARRIWEGAPVGRTRAQLAAIAEPYLTEAAARG